MTDWKQNTIRRLTNGLSSVGARRRIVVGFAKKHRLIYFKSVSPGGQTTHVIRGSSMSPGQIDANHCIGTHAGYDLSLVERTASVESGGYKSSLHRWYVLQIDLKSATNLPFIFVGTRQQTKAYYARLLQTHRQLTHLALETGAQENASFNSYHVVLASPAQLPTVYKLFNDEMIDTIAAHNYPFAVEIEDDSLILITEAMKPNQQLLDKLLHYGLWMAKQIDQRLV